MNGKELKPETKVLAAEWYVPDGWYGSNRRVVLIQGEGQGFNTVKEAMAYKSLLKLFLKKQYNQKLNPDFATMANCPTYKYYGSGPSYSCTNIIVTVNELEEFKSKWESSDEFKELQWKAERRKRLKEYTNLK
jgi:hypothetical protein